MDKRSAVNKIEDIAGCLTRLDNIPFSLYTIIQRVLIGYAHGELHPGLT